MTLFRAAMQRAYGKIAPAVHRDVARRMDEVFGDLVDAAFAQWRQHGWQRFDNAEVNCTVRVYHFLREAVRDSRLPVIVLLDGVQPTSGALRGEENARTSRRPDIRIAVGHEGGITVECKRLSLRGRLPQQYVSEGMYRFVAAAYAASDTSGVMLGYVQDDDPAEIVRAINAAVDVHQGMGRTHRLGAGRDLRACRRYESSHRRTGCPDIALRHYHAVLR